MPELQVFTQEIRTGSVHLGGHETAMAVGKRALSSIAAKYGITARTFDEQMEGYIAVFIETSLLGSLKPLLQQRDRAVTPQALDSAQKAIDEKWSQICGLVLGQIEVACPAPVVKPAPGVATVEIDHREIV